MDFHLSKEHLLVRKMYREFAETEVKPLAEELDEEERFTFFLQKNGLCMFVHQSILLFP